MPAGDRERHKMMHVGLWTWEGVPPRSQWKGIRGALQKRKQINGQRKATWHMWYSNIYDECDGIISSHSVIPGSSCPSLGFSDDLRAEDPVLWHLPCSASCIPDQCHFLSNIQQASSVFSEKSAAPLKSPIWAKETIITQPAAQKMKSNVTLWSSFSRPLHGLQILSLLLF